MSVTRKDIYMDAWRQLRRHGITQSECKIVLDEMFEQIVSAVASGRKAHMRELATFYPSTRAARPARNPTTQEPVWIPKRVTMRARMLCGVAE